MRQRVFCRSSCACFNVIQALFALLFTRIMLENRRLRGMTSKELRTLIWITEVNLSILCSGRAKGIRFAAINKICCYLGCDVGDILKFDGVLEAE